MMAREEAVVLVREHVKKENLLKHILAVEAIMRGLARHFGEDEELWGLLGLLHDVDFEKTMNDPKRHATMTCEILEGKVSEEIIRAVKSHNFENTGMMPESKMEKALIAADAVSGLIVAAALIIPSKKLADVKPESIGRRFKERDFARNCNRENMLYCEQIGLDRNEFFEIALKSLQGIADELGL